jgi:hypothetical protein
MAKEGLKVNALLRLPAILAEHDLVWERRLTATSKAMRRIRGGKTPLPQRLYDMNVNLRLLEKP